MYITAWEFRATVEFSKYCRGSAGTIPFNVRRIISLPAHSQDCVAANPEQEWKCFTAQVIYFGVLHNLLPILQYTYPHIRTPIFMLNSAYDTWQLKEIFQIDYCCASLCSPDQFVRVDEEFAQVRIIQHKYNKTVYWV